VRTLRDFGTADGLKGTGMGHFAAFFSRAYRENDYLIGRLHGVDRAIDIVCDAAGARVAYVQFENEDSLNRAVAAGQPSDRYCLTKTTIEIDELAAGDSTVFADMCRTLGGTLISNAP